MADFFAFFPATERSEIPDAFGEIARIALSPLGADAIESELVAGSALLRTVDSGNKAPIHFHARNDGTGWIVAKGIIFDTRVNDSGDVLPMVLEQLIREEPGDLNRYEGTFAVAAWDAQNRRGWAFNDQAATMHLYVGEHDNGLFVATNALSLARSLGLALSPSGVQEFLARGNLIAPATMFSGLRRMNVGEHVRYAAGHRSISRHWHAYAAETSLSHQEAAAGIADLVVDRVSRYSRSAGSVVSDLTGGLDTRVVTSALERAGLNFMVTVNGPPEIEDVQISHKVAQATGWPLKYFNTESLWNLPIDATMRRELSYRTNGELPFAAVYHQLLSRPVLADLGDVHMIGVGGEFLRYHPWSHELFAIGRHQPADVERAMRYRFLHNPSHPVFANNWLPAYRRRLALQIASVCNELPDTRNTQQLDAVHVWKMTSHTSQYLSGAYNWLPTVAPLSTAGFIKAAVAVPWQYRLTAQFQRRVIQQLSPRAASVVTTYGATAGPVRLSNLHLEARQAARRFGHLAVKMERVLLKGRLSKMASPSTYPPGVYAYPPFLTEEFRHFLSSDRMLSASLFDPEVLRTLLNGDPVSSAPMLLRIATVEQLCQELNVTPDSTFMTASTDA